MTFDPLTTPLIILHLDDGDREFMTMGEACRYVRDNGTPGCMAMSCYALGGAAIGQTFRLGSKAFVIRTRWSETDIRRFEKEVAQYGLYLNHGSYIVAGENVTTPREVKREFGRALGERTSLDTTAVDHMSKYDIDWFADIDMCMRSIEFQLWDEFKDLYKDDEEGWNLLADWLQAAWDAQREGIKRAVGEMQDLMTNVECGRGEFVQSYRDCY